MEEIISVGIDIGTTTTQLIFSKLALENTAGYFSVPRVDIVNKTVIYRSEPVLTPFLDRNTIDAEQVRAIVQQEYACAGIDARQVKAGAVIITGETVKKRNAEALAQSLSGFAGEFVVSPAGPDLEAIIAGKGSGACALSASKKIRVINLDIGGGTANAALFDCGKPVSTGCVDIGGRLIQTDDTGRVLRISGAALYVLQECGLSLTEGERNEPALVLLAERMAKVLDELLGLRPKTDLLARLKTPHSSTFSCEGGADAICFSGGVADVIYGRRAAANPFIFGDIGMLLGKAMANARAARSFTLAQPEETLRATVIGAGSHATTISGSTIHMDGTLLPLKNLPVLYVEAEEYRRLCAGADTGLKERIRWQREQHAAETVAVSLQGERNPGYAALLMLAASLAAAFEDVPPSVPAIVVLEEDFAKALGQFMKKRADRPVLVIDGVRALAHDYVDIGAPLMDGLVVPVAVKTLAFGA